MKYIILWTVIILLCTAILIFAKKQGNKKKTGSKKRTEVFNSIFNLLNRIPIISRKLNDMYIRIYNNELSSKRVIRYKIVKYLLISWIVAILFAIFVIVYFKNNLFVTFTLLFFCYQIKEMVLDHLIGDDTNLLVGLYNYMEELQQNFVFNKDIQKAIEEANKEATNLTAIRHAEKIEKVISDEVSFEEYIADCPNVYLQLLATNCQLTYEYGDKEDVDGKSTFMENISYIRQLISTEVMKRRSLQFWLKKMPILCVLPILAFTPFENWVHGILNQSDIFYKSSLGFIIKIIITAISIACFYIIKAYAQTSKKPINSNKVFWEERLLRYKPFAKFIKVISPKDGSHKKMHYKTLINKSGETTKTEYIYVRKCLFATATFLLSILISVNVHSINTYSIYNDNTSKFTKDYITVNNKQVPSTDLENQLLEYVDIDDINGSLNRVKNKLMQKGIYEQDILVKLSNKIVNKKIALANEHMHIWDFGIAFLLALCMWFVPNISLEMKAEMRKYEMNNEIEVFETVIMILMYHDSATTENILETMSKAANIFKDPIDIILKDFRKGDYEAINEMLNGMFRPFASIIRNVLKVEDIRAKDAFVNLAENRKNQIDIRKENNKRLVNKRISRSSLISLIPLNLVIMIFIAGGMMYVAFTQLNTMQMQMNQLESTSQAPAQTQTK